LNKALHAFFKVSPQLETTYCLEVPYEEIPVNII